MIVYFVKMIFVYVVNKKNYIMIPFHIADERNMAIYNFIPIVLISRVLSLLLLKSHFFPLNFLSFLLHASD